LPFFLKIFLQDKQLKTKSAACFWQETILISRTHNKNRDKMKETVLSTKAPKPVGPYSQGVMADKFLFVSGQLPIDLKQGKIVAVDIESQTKQVMENIKAILEAAGYEMKDVVSTTAYLSFMTLFDQFNAEYAKFFEGEFPARATVACELKAGALVEVSAVAYRG
jgi:2-iminobutanoate/2-iminopropanoate deaminase